MSRIKILDEGTAARIAAGEVVERPASIVKELVENSIDAGASAVSVSIENGGMRKILVSDNGTGIEKEDLPKTVYKHATSKISTVKDLEHISSMGFRGEALFSIAAVSMFTLRSRVKKAEIGAEMRVSGGVMEYCREAGLPEGTTACAENLFYNTPARLRFIKSTSSETSAVSDLVTRFILGNPSISFRYSANGSTVYHSPGSGKLIDAVCSVYGHDIRNRIAPAEAEYGGIRVYGYVGKHTFYQKTARNQSLFVNGRYIKSELVRKAVTRAYGERILKQTYPFFVLFIEMPYGDVDVNVHPNKMQVHFKDEGKLEYVVEEAVRKAVEEFENTAKLEIKPQTIAEIEKPVYKNYDDNGLKTNGNSTAKGYGSMNDGGDYSVRDNSLLNEKAEAEAFLRSVLISERENENKETAEQQSFFPTDDEIDFVKNKPEKNEAEALKLAEISRAKFIGSAFDSYLIFELEDSLYLIDQHAAHERMIYDRLTADGRVISQQLLIPEVLSFPHDQMMLLEPNLKMLCDMGIEAEIFGTLSIKVSAVPQIVGEINIRGFFEDILEGLSYSGKKEIRLAKDRIARAACKRAIKAGMAISREDAEKILEQISKTGVIPHCPHGRPLAIAIAKTELEKGFKRIV